MALTLDLQSLARQSMLAHGFAPDFSEGVRAQVTALAAGGAASPQAPGGVRDVRNVPWSSIDNDTSRDLDQVEAATRLPDGTAQVRVGIADVDALVPKGTAVDAYAAGETTSVYTGVQVFPMLPDAFSTGATSLLPDGDRFAIVIEFVVGADGAVHTGDVYRGLLRNRAQLTYDATGAWLEGRGPAPAPLAGSPDLQVQVRLQDEIARALKTARVQCGALTIETVEVRPVMAGGQVAGVEATARSRATDLIEDFMIAANEIVARWLDARGVSSIRRVVKTPERWPRIVELAAAHGARLPAAPDPKALNEFLLAQRAADPDRFPDLSLAVVKLLGPGEYVVRRPGEAPPGHFGLAVDAYTHSTAPNRRYADLVTQRLIKAAIAGAPAPYTDDELVAIATNCTVKEDAARKVEREMTKRIVAAALSRRVGDVFDAIVTGVTPKGTFVRVRAPHAEGLLAQGQQGVDVGDAVRVRLIRTDVAKGYVDFARVTD